MMEVETKTWERDVMGLFDYESQQSVKQIIRIKQDTGLTLQGNQIEANNDEQGGQTIACVYKKEDDFYIVFSRLTQVGSELKEAQPGYLVVSSLRNQDGSSRGFRLRLGDYIKLGQVEFKVREICSEQLEQKQSLKEQSLLSNGTQNIDSECKLCLEDTNSIDNPLIQCCRCKGTLQFIHLNCLRGILRLRIKQLVKENVFSYKWKTLKCEICLQELSFKIELNGEIIPLITFPRPAAGSYIVLQGITDKFKGLHILKLTKGVPLYLGRGHEADLNINNLIVSRQHARLELDKKGAIRLHDNKSRFGTLVQIQGPLKIQKYHHLVCQVGRTVLTCITDDKIQQSE